MKTVSKRIALALLLIAVLIGACAGWALLNYQPKNESLSAVMEANFQIRPESFQLVATPESQKMMYLFQATQNDFYPAFFMYENGSWVYYWPQTGEGSYVPWKTVFDIPIRMENGDVVWGQAWVDEIGVWMDMTIFNKDQKDA
jgi:hypothetical protein